MRKLLTSLLGLHLVLGGTSWAADQLPDIGDPAGGIISPAVDRELGQEFLRWLRANDAILDDPLLTGYVQELGDRLAAHSGADGPFHFFLVKDPEVNAFAGPGGMIGLHTGLVASVRTESELASVMAHEIAHVTQHHLARAFEEARRMRLSAAVAMLGALIAGGQSADAGGAAIATATAAMAQHQISFTRSHEQEADRIGIRTLAESGYDPQGMATFFQRLEQTHRYSGAGEIPEMLRTHPVSTNRIAEAQARAAQMPAAHAPSTLDFHIAQVRVLVDGAESPTAAERELRARLATATGAPQKDALNYGLALVALARGNGKEARVELERLQRAQPDVLAWRLGLAEALASTGDIDSALRLYRDTLRLVPGDEATLTGLSGILIASGRSAEARETLLAWLRSHDPNPDMLRLMARAASSAGPTGETSLYLAEAEHLDGQMQEAIRQLELGMDQAGIDSYMAARLAARLADLRAEVRAREAER